MEGHIMKKFFFLFLFLSLINAVYGQFGPSNTTPQALPFSQSWADNGLITVDDDWSGVPGIVGYRGDDLTTTTGVDPQTILADGTTTPVDVNANKTDPNTFTSGGVAEFEITDPVVAFQGSGTADAPFLLINIETTGKENIRVQYDLRDIDGSGDNSIQQVALQYRIGTSGDFTNLPAGYVADASTGPSLATLVTPVDVTLPGNANNQSVVQVRIITTNAVGNDELIGVDNISITGSTTGSSSIVTGTVSAPPFCINSTITSSGTVAYTSAGNFTNATFTAYLSDATGSFPLPLTNIGSASVNGSNPSGSINITIPAGLLSSTGYKIRIDCASPSITGSASSSFEIINGAKDVSSALATKGESQVTLSWANPSGCYDEIMIVAKALTSITATPTGNGTAYTGNLAFGSGTGFDGGYVVYKGSSSPQTVTNLTNGTLYYFKLFTRYGTNWSAGVEVSTTPSAIPALTEIILPQYIQGTGTTGANNNRVPFVFRVKLDNLLPSSTYRYINQVVSSSDGPTTNGAGNIIYVNSDNSFTRTSSPGFTTAGGYGEFTTDASGSYTGWFITEPSGNARFVVGGNIFMRIRLNDGAGGTTAVTYLTTPNPVKVINFSTQNSDTAGTAIYGKSFSSPKDFVFLYDNVAGTGRPVTSTLVENDGIDLSTVTSIASFYRNKVDNKNGYWGTIIPNQLANGIRRIERRALSNGNLLFSNTDADGVWPSSANTVNPGGGLTPLYITSGEAPLALFKTLNLTALIQGLYNNVSNTMFSDTVIVELRSESSPYSLVEGTNETILSSTGIGQAYFGYIADATNYYIVFKHRNSVETWSAAGQQFTSGLLNYDFTTAANKAFGSNMIQKGLKWCIYNGDVNQDGVVDLSDVANVDTDNLNFVTGWVATDVNGDSLVDLSDLSLVDTNNLNFVSKVNP